MMEKNISPTECKRPEVAVVGLVNLDVNNDRRIRISQHDIDGPISVRVLGAPYKSFDPHSRPCEYEYEISPGDMVMMLNWYRYQKANGNENLMF